MAGNEGFDPYERDRSRRPAPSGGGNYYDPNRGGTPINTGSGAPAVPNRPAPVASPAPVAPAGPTMAELITGRRDAERQAFDYRVPFGFESSRIPIDYGSDIVDAILAEQRGDAQGYVDRAVARGQLSPVGSARANELLDTQGTTARARLDDIRGGLVEGGRAELAPFRTRELDVINALGVNTPYNLNERIGELDTITQGILGNFEGNLRAGAGTSLFNPSSAATAGGIAQGVYNPTTAPGSGATELLAAIERNRAAGDQRRGLGSSGSF